MGDAQRSRRAGGGGRALPSSPPGTGAGEEAGAPPLSHASPVQRLQGGGGGEAAGGGRGEMLQCSAGQAGEGSRKPSTGARRKPPGQAHRSQRPHRRQPRAEKEGRTRPQPGARREDPAERAAGAQHPPFTTLSVVDNLGSTALCSDMSGGRGGGEALPPRAGQARAEAAAAAAITAPAPPLRPKLPRPAAARWLGWALPRGAFLLRLLPPPSSSSSSS